MRFFWPGMYKYCKDMISKCAGCKLANPDVTPAKELIYSFPIDAPMTVLHVDGYQVGTDVNFSGDRCFLVACCGMCTFAAAEPVAKANSTNYAQALVMTMLRYGIAHTIVLDKDSKFYATFRQTCELLQLNAHTISGGNHNPMIVERINRYYNKGLKIFTNERDSTSVSREGIMLLTYAWNASPVPMTDISRSMIVCGRDFAFPIDYSHDKASRLTGDAKWADTFAAKQAKLLLHSREIAKLIIQETRELHRERMIARRPDPRQYEVGDKVLCRRTVQSNKAKGIVDKVQYAYNGPWEVVSKLPGASYEIKHVASGRMDKKHAMHLSPMPYELVPFAPVDGVDTRYGQLHKGIDDKAYKIAGVDGFLPHDPFKGMKFPTKPFKNVKFKVASAAALHHQDEATFPRMPTLAELNEELLQDADDPWTEEELEATLANDDIVVADYEHQMQPTFAMAAAKQRTTGIKPPKLVELHAQLLQSRDCLFFIAHVVPGTSTREWQLIRIAYSDTMAVHPECLHDGKFLVDFYILHHEDKAYDAPNQRYWLEYHKYDDLNRADHATAYHLVKPSPESEQWARRHGLYPYRQWCYVAHDDVYIHGPFDFALNARGASRDRVSQSDWEKLSSAQHMYCNEAPVMRPARVSVHCTWLMHQEIEERNVVQWVISAPLLTKNMYPTDNYLSKDTQL